VAKTRDGVTAVVDESAPRHGIELRSVALNHADETWEPLRERRRPLTFATEADALQYVARLLASQPHLRLRIVAVE
jgi:hypothetical protein